MSLVTYTDLRPQTEDNLLSNQKRMLARLGSGVGASELSLLTSAARTASTFGPIVENPDVWPGIMVWINVSAISVGASITPRLFAMSGDSWIQDFARFNAAISTATQQDYWIIYPGAGLIGRPTGAFTDPTYSTRAPLRWRFYMEHATADSATYEVKYRYLP